MGQALEFCTRCENKRGCDLCADLHEWIMERLDAEKVVRCKMCKHSTLPAKLTQIYGEPGTMTCHNRNSPCNNRNVNERDFCRYGEREEGADHETD